MWRNTPTKSRYQRQEINRHTNQHQSHASCNETPTKKIFGERRGISSGRRVHFKTKKYTNKPQKVKVCRGCNQTVNEADLTEHELYECVFQHYKYTCTLCNIDFFDMPSRNIHKRTHDFFKFTRYQDIFIASKVYPAEEEDDNATLTEEMANTTTNYQESDYVVQYECQKCNKMFASEYSKKMHRNKMHPLFEGRLFSKKAVLIENESVPQNKLLKNDGSVSRRSSNNIHGQAKATPPPSRPATPRKLNKYGESIAKQFNVESESKKTMSRPSSLEYDLDYMCKICKVVFPENKRKWHRREHPELDPYEILFVKIDFPNLGRGKKANAEYITPRKRKSNDHCNIYHYSCQYPLSR